MARSLVSLVRNVLADLQHLWVVGLALLQIVEVASLFPQQGLRLTWLQYLLLGTLFPLLLLAISWTATRFSPEPLFLKSIKLGLGLTAVVIPIFFFGRQPGGLALLAAAGQCLLLSVFFALRHRFTGCASRVPCTPVSIFIVALSWLVSVRLIWWETFATYLARSPFAVLVLVASAILVTINVYHGQAANEGPRFRFFTLGNGLAFILFLFAGLRIDYHEGLVHLVPYHHWGVMIGPAELVRQGGWLLWDVPSQYGFLSTLTLAWLPTHSVWQSLYLVHAVLLCGVACFLFLLLRSLRTGLSNYCFSLAITLAAVCLIPGWPPLLTGSYFVPAVSPFRFFWCYALLAVILWAVRTEPGDRLQKRILGLGCAAWLLGSLWSGESMAYCATIWLPAYFFLLLRRASALYPAPEQGRLRLRAAAVGLAWPPLMLLCAAAGIAAYYAAVLGHLPDLHVYLDFCLAAGHFFYPLDLGGPLWVLVLMFFALAMLAAALFGKRHVLGPLALSVGAWSALWATSSYFVARSHESNVTNQAAMLCTALGLGLYLLRSVSVSERLSFYTRLSFIPVLTVLLTMTFGNLERVSAYGQSLRRGYIRNVDRLLPWIDPACEALLQAADVKADDPILFLDGTAAPNHLPTRWLPARPGGPAVLTSQYRAWLPTEPFALFRPLSDERTSVYLARFSARTHLSGWLLQPRKQRHAFSWFFEQVRRTHWPARTFSNEQWQLTWYEWRPESSMAAVSGDK